MPDNQRQFSLLAEGAHMFAGGGLIMFILLYLAKFGARGPLDRNTAMIHVGACFGAWFIGVIIALAAYTKNRNAGSNVFTAYFWAGIATIWLLVPNYVGR